jgi:hypothetical protein
MTATSGEQYILNRVIFIQLIWPYFVFFVSRWMQMDPDSGYHLFHTRGYHLGPYFGARAAVPVPPEAQRGPTDLQRALDPRVHICPLPARTLDVAVYHALLFHIQFKLQGWKQFC